MNILFIIQQKNNILNLNNARKKLSYSLDEDKLHKKFKYTYLKKFKKTSMQEILLNYKLSTDEYDIIKKYIVDYFGINVYIIYIDNTTNTNKIKIIYSTNDCNNFLKIKPTLILINIDNIYYPVFKYNKYSIFCYSNEEDKIIIDKLLTLNTEKIEEHNEKKIIIDNEEYTLKKLKNLKLLGIKELCTKSNIDFKKKSIKSDKLINKTKDDLIKNILELDIINY